MSGRADSTVLLSSLALNPDGQLSVEAGAAEQFGRTHSADRIVEAFTRDAGEGLLVLGGVAATAALPSHVAFWRDFAVQFITAVCSLGEDAESTPAIPSADELNAVVFGAPPMEGGEYLTADVLRRHWAGMQEALAAAVQRAGTVRAVLAELNPAWSVVGRVHFNLAENKADPDSPFAFVATYTTRLGKAGKAQHVRLGQALEEFKSRREQLLKLLKPVNAAAEQVSWLKEMVDDGAVFEALAWTTDEALRFLRDVPKLESSGIVVRMPAQWRTKGPPRVKVAGTVGTRAPGSVGLDALLNFDVAVSVEGETLSAAEVAQLMAAADGLVFIRGQWVEVDQEALKKVLKRFKDIQRLASSGGLTFAEAMRMLARADIDGGELAAPPEWSTVVAGPWLSEALAQLRTPVSRELGVKGLAGTLRHYQADGLAWLSLLHRLRLGGVLADDMGLGKTIQFIALLLRIKQEGQTGGKPNLLVAPASLMGNWMDEVARFAPELRTVVLHGAFTPSEVIKDRKAVNPDTADLVITSYGALNRIPWLLDVEWGVAAIDEAQAIKNAGTQQARAAKRVKARVRVALTGTPLENRLSDLWSIFDFVNPGLLGSAREFANFVKRLEGREHRTYAPLRELVRPYILRRMKTDKSIIADLPDKTEINAYCMLSAKQVALYEREVQALSDALESKDGIARRGVILTTMLRLKQICNHPSQWLGDGEWAPKDSGKWTRLRELAEVIAAKREKALVFTQFKEMTEPLSAFLGTVFGRDGLILHGGTSVKERRELVRRFDEDDAVPFFVLSLKAGGVGLNMTRANHVIHFDRWWNPAVESQATDRAFRIGQMRNVLVNKFVCRGTVEQRIDELIESKKSLAADILDGGAEISLTEMSNEDLLRLVRLDIKSAELRE